MPKNPFTGEEMNEELFNFIGKHNSSYQFSVVRLNKLYVDDLLSSLQTKVELLDFPPKEEEIQKDAETFEALTKEVAGKREEVEFFKKWDDLQQAREEFGALNYAGYETSERYFEMMENCEKLGISVDVVKKSVDGFFKNPNVIGDVKNKTRTLGGEDGIIEKYAMKEIQKANGGKPIGENEGKAIKDVIACACKEAFISEELDYAGNAYYLKEAAREKMEAAEKAYNKAKEKTPDRKPIDRDTYDEYENIIDRYDKIASAREEMGKAFTFPKANYISAEGQNEALEKYAEARDRANSHWGITKFFASLMPGLFKETAKDMADEQSWRESLIKADFTEEDLKNARPKEKPVNKVAENAGEEIEDMDVSSKLFNDINKGKVEAKTEEKQQGIDPNLDKNKGEKNKGGLQA